MATRGLPDGVSQADYQRQRRYSLPEQERYREQRVRRRALEALARRHPDEWREVYDQEMARYIAEHGGPVDRRRYPTRSGSDES